jgi:hypothetical protein
VRSAQPRLGLRSLTSHLTCPSFGLTSGSTITLRASGAKIISNVNDPHRGEQVGILAFSISDSRSPLSFLRDIKFLLRAQKK